MVTDGDDNESAETLEQAVRRLQGDGGPTVYAIGILEKEEHPKHAKRALQIMSERTGGIAFFPQTLDEVDAISRTVAHDIRTPVHHRIQTDDAEKPGRLSSSESGRPFAQLRQTHRPHEERVLRRKRAGFRGAVEVT